MSGKDEKNIGYGTSARVEELAKRPDFLDLSGKFSRTRHAQPGSFGPRDSQLESSSQQQQQTRDDVVFVSSKDSETSALWVNYLTACFEQISRQQGRPPFSVVQVTFEEPNSPGTDLKIRNSRLQIIVVCPIFLERVGERPEQASNISRQLNSERVLAMMLGVQESHLSIAQRASLTACETWRKFFVKDQDETFVGQFLGAAVAILGTGSAAPSNSLKVDKTGFSVHPKKVKMGQNKVLALLNEPLHQDDSVTVIVDRCGEAIEISNVKRRNPYTLQFAIPDRCLDVSMLVGVRIVRNGTFLGVKQLKCESRLRELDQILRAHDNPLEFMCQTFGFNSGDKEQLDNWMVHAFQKNLPPHFNLLSNPVGDFQLSKNHSSSEENPTLLHFAARFGLDKLAWQLLECPGADIACDMRNTSDLTPADLAEQAGHVRLAHQLRGYMQMNEFSNMYSYLKVMSESTTGNSNGQAIPANSSSSFQPWNVLQENEGSHHSEDYCRPRPISEAYSVPPIARPVPGVSGSFPDYSTPPPLRQLVARQSAGDDDDGEGASSNVSTPVMPIYASTSTLDASSLELPFQGLRSTSDSTASSTPTGLTPTPCQLVPQRPRASAQKNQGGDGFSSDQQSAAPRRSRSSASSKQSSKTSEEPQDELLEIITDFKNNVFTISEVERLVENWRNRNDVQQSFKDKQIQLAAMRDEYERIQKRMKEDMKASSTPFDRIKKLFIKGKKVVDSERDSAGISTTTSTTIRTCSSAEASANPNGQSVDHRPVSSLSLHSVSSSSSSGRMSTVSEYSGASLGDSGTHSDAEDRRIQHPITESKSRITGMTNCYEVPPAPKPFNALRLYNGVHHHHNHHHCHQPGRFTPDARTPGGTASNSELDLRVVKSSYPTADDKEYYIAFPPSGLPVHCFKPDLVNKQTFVSDASIDGKKSCIASSNYTNITPTTLTPPLGACMPFQYMNLTAEPIVITKDSNVLTVQPEIHPIPVKPNIVNKDDENEMNNGGNDEDDLPLPTPPPPPLPLQDDSSAKILCSKDEVIHEELICNVPDYTNVQVAASEKIAKNFGFTLKKLSPPPVPPRGDFSFSSSSEKNSPIVITDE